MSCNHKYIQPGPAIFSFEDFGYQLLDMGDGRKLERLGSHSIIRPAPQAIWPKRLDDEAWQSAEAEYRYFKGKESGGEWTFHKRLPAEGWTLGFRDLTFKVNPTGFGHIGLFPEQAPNWVWTRDRLERRDKLNILNVFGYTGAGTLAAAAAGARVTHVDASRPSVAWARRNLELSGLRERPVRWIVDDVLKFLKRERRRGNRYHGIIMDPPTFGRGAKKEVWKIERDLPELMDLCRQILAPDPVLLLVSAHTPGFSALTLENMLLTYLANPKTGVLESGEMSIYDNASGLSLPSGFYSRWRDN